MPEIGSITIYKDRRHIWVACPICGHERWVKLTHPEPLSLHCGNCRAWKGGKNTDKRGYVHIKLFPNDFYFPMVNSHGYVLEHRLVMAKKLGRCLQDWEIIHHKGIRYIGIQNRADNLEDNLELSSSTGEHSLNHSKGYRDGYQKGLVDGKDKQIAELKFLIEEQTKQIKLLRWQTNESLRTVR